MPEVRKVTFPVNRLATVLAIPLLSACSGGDDGGTPVALMSLSITDGPVEQAESVVVTFTAVELKPKSGNSIVIELETPQSINLLDYQGELSAPLLSDVALTPGEYNWMRLAVDPDENWITIDGSQYALEIPSGSESGLKLNRGFTLAAGSQSDFTIDFDLRKSVHQEGTGDYKLRPVLRLVNNLETGVIEGTVAAALIESASCENGTNNDQGNAVYIYAGEIAQAVDLRGTASDPLTTASVTLDNDSQTYTFTAAWLPAGDYQLAFTCQAIADDPLTADTIAFSTLVPASVSADLTTTVEVE